jgi:hypothetical protein
MWKQNKSDKHTILNKSDKHTILNKSDKHTILNKSDKHTILILFYKMWASDWNFAPHITALNIQDLFSCNLLIFRNFVIFSATF